MGEQFYRVPWQADDEMHQFRAEMTSALRNQPDGFALRGQGQAALAPPVIQSPPEVLPVAVAAPMPVPSVSPAAETPAPVTATPVTPTPVTPAPPPAASALDYLRGNGVPPIPAQTTAPPPEPPKGRGFFSRLLGGG